MEAHPLKDHYSYYDEGKEDQIWEWVNSSGDGIMQFTFGDLPDECIAFCLEQYHRFSVPFPSEMHDVLVSGASASFSYVDTVDPYALFKGVSDVDLSYEWTAITFQILDQKLGGGRTYEADPQFLETFCAMPGQAEEMFAQCIARPGLDALPFGIGENIRSVMDGDWGEDVWATIDAETDLTLREICTAPGAMEPDKKRMMAYFELSAWAAFIWLAGPLGRQWRMTRHDIMHTAMAYGECILYQHTIISPDFYLKIARPPQSCYKCGVQAWCVENTLVGGNASYICESCLFSHGSLGPFGAANCGTKLCRESRCPHHPFAHMGQAGAFATVGKHGQLAAMTRQKRDLRLTTEQLRLGV